MSASPELLGVLAALAVDMAESLPRVKSRTFQHGNRTSGYFNHGWILLALVGTLCSPPFTSPGALIMTAALGLIRVRCSVSVSLSLSVEPTPTTGRPCSSHSDLGSHFHFSSPPISSTSLLGFQTNCSL